MDISKGDQPRPVRVDLLLIAGLAMLYYAAGYLSLLMAIAPGFSSPVWPATGIALAALLFYGNRVWPGVLIGSFLINLPGLLDAASSNSIIQSLIIAASIGAGSSLQALAGSCLIKCTININSGLLDTKSVSAFLGLGGPLSCLISASWGVATLSMFGVIDSDELVYNWIIWWSGDTLGVLFMLPLLFIWFAHPRAAWEPRKTRVALPLLVTVAAVVIVFLVASQQQQDQDETNFKAQAQILGDTLEKKITRNLELVYSLQQLFTTAEFVDRDQFKNYVQRALARNPSIFALSWNPVIAHQNRASFENTMQRQGFSQFSFSERSAAGSLIRASQRDHYAIVHYIEPLQTNHKSLGYDIYSDPDRKKTLDDAHSRRELTATIPIKLVQESDDQMGVLFMLPVYGHPRDSRVAAAKTNLPDGVVVGVFRVGSLLLDGLDAIRMPNVFLRLSDVTDADNPRQMANCRVGDGQKEIMTGNAAIEALTGLMQWQKTMHFGARTWLFEVHASSAHFTANRSWTAWGILIWGLLFSALLGTFLLILTGHAILDQNRADVLAAEITEREKIALALKDANDALEKIASTDSLTQILNRRAIEDIGFKLDAEAKRYQINYSVLMLDIDHFKRINDRWGHKTGDLVLKEFVSRIGKVLRSVDYFGRWGGEEFVILARNTPLHESTEFAERLCLLIADNDFEAAGKVTVSIGIAGYKAGEIFEDVILRSDRALYQAKQNGRNRVEFEA